MSKVLPRKLHFLDKSKTGFCADAGTACGIRLRKEGPTYLTRPNGDSHFSELRLVVEDRNIVTCQRCRAFM